MRYGWSCRVGVRTSQLYVWTRQLGVWACRLGVWICQWSGWTCQLGVPACRPGMNPTRQMDIGQSIRQSASQACRDRAMPGRRKHRKLNRPASTNLVRTGTDPPQEKECHCGSARLLCSAACVTYWAARLQQNGSNPVRLHAPRKTSCSGPKQPQIAHAALLQPGQGVGGLPCPPHAEAPNLVLWSRLWG